ncbi:MAG: esterase/lipase family protein [Vicinamibacterales bacterium]
MAAHHERIVPFTAGDGFQCNLIHVTTDRPPTRGPVVLVHGAGVRANIFRAPVQTTVVDALLEHGYDVWLENWRASIDLPPNKWTLDQAALYDHPAAVETIVHETGADQVKAIIHCQGSTSFIMSAIAGLVPQVSTIVSNAVSLHTVVPKDGAAKLKYAMPAMKRLTDYLNPQWGRRAPTPVARMVRSLVNLTHHECDNAVCKHASFIYGAGHPTLWRHENLNPETHAWLSDEFAEVPMVFFEQMGACVEKGHLVSVEGHPKLPADFAAHAPRTEARVAFITGELNDCFVPESQIRSFEHFDRLRPGFHTLRIFPSYGHLDVFMGQQAARDTFPTILDELDKPA